MALRLDCSTAELTTSRRVLSIWRLVWAQDAWHKCSKPFSCLFSGHVYVFGSILLVLGVWRIFGAMSNDPTCMLFFTILDFIKSLGINIYVVTSLARSSWVGTYIMLHSFTLTLSCKRLRDQEGFCSVKVILICFYSEHFLLLVYWVQSVAAVFRGRFSGRILWRFRLFNRRPDWSPEDKETK